MLAISAYAGIILFIKRNCGYPAIVDVAVDRDVSNMDIPDDNMRTLFDRVEVSLTRTAYDRASFLKIDLRVGAIKCGNAP